MSEVNIDNKPEVSNVPEVDLITKVNDFKKSQVNAEPKVDNNLFDYKEIEDIKDPVAKEIAMKAYKSMQAGFTKKTQDLAEQRKSVEAKIQEMQNWSPERIQRELLNNPQFVQAAQQIAGVTDQNPQNSGLTDEQFSALTDKEKAELSAIKNQNSVLANEINNLKQSNYQALVAQRDAELKTRFTDYNPLEIDNTIKTLSSMNPVEIREHVYKSLRFEESVKAAYELGRSEKNELNKQKIDAFSTNGSASTNSGNFPVRDKNDNDLSWFQKLANFRLSESKKR